MMIVVLISLSVTLFAYVIMSLIEERLTTKRRLAFAIGARTQSLTQVKFNRDKLIEKIAQEQRERMAKRPPLSALLIKAGLDISARKLQFIMLPIALISGILVYSIINILIVAGLVALFAFLVIPRLVLSVMIGRRQAAFLDGFPEALDMISRGLKAGMPLATCLKQIAENTVEPIRSEFAYVLDLQKIGIPLAEAVKKMPERIDLLDLRFFTIVIEIQQKSGGNLSEIIENISFVIRGRKEMRAKIKALISEAKVSAIIIGALPIFFGALSWYSDAEGFSKFWTEAMGQILLGISITLYVSGMGIFIYLATPKT